MRAGIQANRNFPVHQERTSAFVPLALLSVGVLWSMWIVVALLRSRASQALPFGAAAGSFVILAIAYLALHGLRENRWACVPVLLTIESLISFAVVPTWQFALGNVQIDSVYVHTMFLVAIGFTAFWVASLLLKRRDELSFAPQSPETSPRVTLICLAMLILGASANFFMWRKGLFSYSADPGLLEAKQGIMQWLNFGSSLMYGALIVSSIEVFGKPAVKPLMRTIFWISLAVSLLLGVVAGMKSGLITPMLYVVIVFAITHRRLPRAAILLPGFFLVVVYPFVSAYRENLNAGYRAQANTLSGIESAVVQSFNDAFLTFGSGHAGAGSTDSMLNRLNHLAAAHDVVGLPAPSLLNGDEKVWLAPVYPLIPRLLWKDKPVMNKGVRLSLALGGDRFTSDALTIIGDLYSLNGTYGVIFGMFIYGLGLQQYTNWAGGRMSERGLFIYASMLLTLLDFESGFVATIGGFIHMGLVVVFTSYVIYGRSSSRIPAAVPVARYAPDGSAIFLAKRNW